MAERHNPSARSARKTAVWPWANEARSWSRSGIPCSKISKNLSPQGVQHSRFNRPKDRSPLAERERWDQQVHPFENRSILVGFADHADGYEIIRMNRELASRTPLMCRLTHTDTPRRVRFLGQRRRHVEAVSLPSLNLARPYPVCTSGGVNWRRGRKGVGFLNRNPLAGVVGFEPTIHGTKNRCLTAWLHPNSERLSSQGAPGLQAQSANNLPRK